MLLRRIWKTIDLFLKFMLIVIAGERRAYLQQQLFSHSSSVALLY